MATIKSFTDLQQSKKLAEILPLESADMYRVFENNAEPRAFYGKPSTAYFVCEPCWSLAALLEQLPYELCDDDGNSYYLSMNKDDDMYQLFYSDRYGEFDDIETDIYKYFVDACYEMIIRLNELNLL